MEFIEVASGAIIDKLKTILDQDVAVTDLEGNIAADSEMKYFGKFVPGARDAIRQNQTLKIPAEQLEMEQDGWATPLVYDKQIVGSLVVKNAQTTSAEQIPLARSLAELLIHQVMVLRLLPQTAQMLDKFFHDILEEAGADQEKLMEQSRFLDSHYYQTKLDSNRIVILVNIPGFWEKILGTNIFAPAEENSKIANVKESLRQTLKPYASQQGDVLVVYFSGDNFVVLLAEPTAAQKTYEKISKEIKILRDAMRRKTQEEIKIALPPFHAGLSGLIRSYHIAKDMLSLAQKLMTEKSVILEEDIVLPRLISFLPREERQNFSIKYLDGILKEPALLSTLSAYFAADLNLKETAHNLNIHKNTLYYRFEKIRKQIGLDPRSFHNAVMLSVALLIQELDKNRGGEKQDTAVSAKIPKTEPEPLEGFRQ